MKDKKKEIHIELSSRGIFTNFSTLNGSLSGLWKRNGFHVIKAINGRPTS